MSIGGRLDYARLAQTPEERMRSTARQLAQRGQDEQQIAAELQVDPVNRSPPARRYER